MGHFGVLETSEHPNGLSTALDDAHMRRFPITAFQRHNALERGHIVYDVSVGQGVVLRNGACYAHGTQDGLHEVDDTIFS